MDSFLQIIQNAGWIGTIVIILVLYRTGVLKDIVSYLLGRNGKKNGDYEIIKGELEELKNNHLHEISDGLKRIEDNLTRNFVILHEKNNKVIEMLTYLKARVNGRE